MHIQIKKGLNIPLKGMPQGKLQLLPLPSTVSLDLSPFDHLRFTLLKKIGDQVRAGEPIVQAKDTHKLIFVSPGSGVVKEIVRGLKRRLLRVIIAVNPDEQPWLCEPLEIDSAPPDQVMQLLLQGGIFPHIQVRPSFRLPDVEKLPEAVFIRALASAPFAPSPELEVLGKEKEFACGLKVLQLLCPDQVHLVFHASSSCEAFIQAQDIVKHTALGPHPIESSSIHIEAIYPIFNRDQVIWTLNVSTVIGIGNLLINGASYTDQVISIAGEGVSEEKRGFFRLCRGYPARELVHSHCSDPKKARLISGDPLMGEQIDEDGYIGFFHSVFCAIPEIEEKREMLHFLRPCRRFYTATATYLPKWWKKNYSFTTHRRGEERAFVDPTIYNRVMPLLIPIVPLIKALLAEDYVAAEELGLLEVAPEDFALPTFVCPSKVEMVAIIERGIKAYRAQYYL
ncbi:MAG: NADH:ubiquinone reductase (Na(+)-transporting) subunit A [Chlamydiota bacterium]